MNIYELDMLFHYFESFYLIPTFQVLEFFPACLQIYADCCAEFLFSFPNFPIVSVSLSLISW